MQSNRFPFILSNKKKIAMTYFLYFPWVCSNLLSDFRKSQHLFNFYGR